MSPASSLRRHVATLGFTRKLCSEYEAQSAARKDVQGTLLHFGHIVYITTANKAVRIVERKRAIYIIYIHIRTCGNTRASREFVMCAQGRRRAYRSPIGRGEQRELNEME